MSIEDILFEDWLNKVDCEIMILTAGSYDITGFQTTHPEYVEMYEKDWSPKDAAFFVTE